MNTLNSILSSSARFFSFGKFIFAVCFGALLCFAPLSYAAKSSTPAAATVAKVSINAANAELVAEVMVGVGLKRAEAIVAFRKANGKFRAIEDLANVKGIGEATIAKNRQHLML